MLFSSMTFVFVFLPIVLFLYLVTKKELHNPILLIASIIFYAWAEPKYLAIMLLTIIVNYCGALVIEKVKSCQIKFAETNSNNLSFLKYILSPKLILALTVIINLGFLVYFKYFNFIITNINSLFHSNINLLNVVLPIGISFYTFQALSYVIDVYRGEVKAQKDFYKLALYISLFPQLVAGPIVKYHDVAEQIDSREVNFEKVSLGVKRFIIGLSKKMLLANSIGLIADKIFIQDPHSFSHAIAWFGAVAYSLQLYFDFSGYSDMAIGLGLIFGFKFMENFNYPFISRSITEMWTRWHISLSTWFKQYVYFPLGGSRCSKLRSNINLAIVFLLTGIWHGAEWTFVAWGVWNSFFIVAERLCNIKKFNQTTHSWWINGIMHIYFLFTWLIGVVIFRSENLTYAWNYLLNMYGILKIKPETVLYSFTYYADNMEIIAFVVAIMCSMPIFKNMLEVKNKYARAGVNLWLFVLFFLSTITIAASTYNPFIYFRF